MHSIILVSIYSASLCYNSSWTSSAFSSFGVGTGKVVPTLLFFFLVDFVGNVLVGTVVKVEVGMTDKVSLGVSNAEDVTMGEEGKTEEEESERAEESVVATVMVNELRDGADVVSRVEVVVEEAGRMGWEGFNTSSVAKIDSHTHSTARTMAYPPTRRHTIQAATMRKVKKVRLIKKRSVKSRCLSLVSALEEVRRSMAKGPW